MSTLATKSHGIGIIVTACAGALACPAIPGVASARAADAGDADHLAMDRAQVVTWLQQVGPVAHDRADTNDDGVVDLADLSMALDQGEYARGRDGRRSRTIISGAGACELQKQLASDGHADHFFGWEVAVEGDTAMVNAGFDVYVFQRIGESWEEVQKLTGDGPGFGSSIGISGDTAAIGDWSDDEGARNSGAVHILERQKGDRGLWGEMIKLKSSDFAESDFFGGAVALDGDVLVVGAWAKDDLTGAAYAFERDQGGLDQWGEVSRLTPHDPAPSTAYGVSVDVDGHTAVIGAVQDGEGGDHAGAAYLFERDGAGFWYEARKLIGSDTTEWSFFGRSVAIAEDTVLVGAQIHDAGAPRSGAAYVFERHEGGEESWGEVVMLALEDPGSNDQFGFSATLDGDTAVVGSWLRDDLGEDSGAAYVFDRHQGGTDNWGRVARLLASDGDTEDYFGWALDIDFTTALAGAPSNADYGENTGAAYLFDLPGCSK